MSAKGGSASGGKKYDLIVFDFDGTLVDTVKDIAYHANSVLDDYGYAVCPVRKVRGAIGLGVHELLKGLAPDLGRDAARLEEAVDLFKKRYRGQPVKKTEAYSGVRAMLEGPLSQTKKAIVTNKPQDITLTILKKLKLDSFFETVIGMNAGFLPKPDPSSILHVIQTLGCVPGKTVFVGDSGIDAAAAVNAGVDFAWVSYGYDDPKNIEPAYRFSSAAEWRLLAV